MKIRISNRAEATIAIFAALLVLFSAMLEPLVSAGIAVAVLVALGIYHFVRK